MSSPGQEPGRAGRRVVRSDEADPTVGVTLSPIQGVVTLAWDVSSDCAPLSALRINDTGETGVVEVESVEPLGEFSTTRPALQTALGNNGDGGITGVHGYSTRFDQGLAMPAEITLTVTSSIAGGLFEYGSGCPATRDDRNGA